MTGGARESVDADNEGPAHRLAVVEPGIGFRAAPGVAYRQLPLLEATRFPQQARGKAVGLPGLSCGFSLEKACETTTKDTGFPVEKT